MLDNDTSNEVHILCVLDDILRDIWGQRWSSGISIQHQGIHNKSGEQISRSHNNIKAYIFAYPDFPYDCSHLSLKCLI